MAIKVLQVKKFLFCAFIILMPFEDSILGKLPTTVFTCNLAIIPLILLFLFSGFDYFKMIFRRNHRKLLLGLYLSINIISAMYYFLYLGYSANLVFYKGLSNFILFFFFMFAAYVAYNMFSIKEDIELYKKCLFIAVVIAVVGVIGNYIFPSLFNSSMIHNLGANDFDRIRGFSSEPSNLSYILPILVFLYLSLVNINLKHFWQVFFIFISMGFITQSKGLLILSFAYMLLGTYFFHMNRIFRRITLIILCVSIGFLCWKVIQLMDVYHNLLQLIFFSSTTFGTRFVMFLLGMKSIFIFTGNGFVGYYPYIIDNINWGVNFLNNIFPFRLNFSELVITRESLAGVGTKTLFLDYSIIFGLPFIFLYITTGVRLWKLSLTNCSVNQFLLVLTLFMPPLFYIPVIPFSYCAPIALGYLLSLLHDTSLHR